VEGSVQMLADVGRVLPNVLPEMPGGDMEAVLVRIGGEVGIVVLRPPILILLLPHITEAFEEEEAENVMPVVGGIDGPSQDVGRLPEMAFELAEGQNCHDSGFQARDTGASPIPELCLVAHPSVRLKHISGPKRSTSERMDRRFEGRQCRQMSYILTVKVGEVSQSTGTWP